MAIKNIFKELDKILASYDAHEAIRGQSERFVTEVFYTEEWTRGVILDVIKTKIGQVSGTESSQILSAVRRLFNRQTTVSKWRNYLIQAGFTVLEGKEISGIPEDYQENNNMQVSVTAIPTGVKVTFYQSYTAEAGIINDKHGKAQKKYIVEYAQAVAEELNRKNFSKSSSLGRNVRDFNDPTADPMFVPHKSFEKASSYKGYRLHGNTGRHTGAGERSDTTRALIDLLEKVQQKDIPFSGTTSSAMTFIKEKVNQKVNAAYKIEGIDKIDLFKDQNISKTVKIKIIFGVAEQNELLAFADKTGRSKDKGIDSLLTNIRDDLMRDFGKDLNKKGSKSVAELNTLGAFAHIPKEMKTASGLPDMRFKVNKKILKFQKLMEKSEGQKGTTIKKGSKRRIGANTASSTRSLDTGRYDRNTEDSTTSLASLMQIVNAQLPRFLKTNMTPPRLQYRGRGNPSRPFAGPFNTGVDVTSITDSKSNPGGINVNYTYEKYPYQTFEPGFKQGDVFRDPREVIKESITQIMIQNKQNRFMRFRRH